MSDLKMNSIYNKLSKLALAYATVGLISIVGCECNLKKDVEPSGGYSAGGYVQTQKELTQQELIDEQSKWPQDSIEQKIMANVRADLNVKQARQNCWYSPQPSGQPVYWQDNVLYYQHCSKKNM